MSRAAQSRGTANWRYPEWQYVCRYRPKSTARPQSSAILGIPQTERPEAVSGQGVA